MGNLNHTTQQFLYNTVAATDFGVYTDSVTGVKNLLIKGFGYALPAVGESVVKHSYSAGTAKSVYVKLATTCPCDDCGAEYGIEIQNYDQLPGVFKYYLPIRKFYGGSWENVVCSGTTLDSTLVDEATSAIVRQIGLDTLGAGAIVTAKTQIAATVTAVSEGTTYALTVTSYNSANVATSCNIAWTAAGGDDIDDLITGFNADLGAYATATKVTATTILITSAAGTYLKAVEVGSGDVTLDSENRILLTAKSADRQFNVMYKAGSATTTVVTAGTWPTLTSADVARQFSIKPYQHGSQPNVPIKDAEYVKYTIKATMGNVDDISAPNHVESFVQTVELYILKSAINAVDIWDASGYMWESTADNAGFSPDQTFDEILTYWQA